MQRTAHFHDQIADTHLPQAVRGTDDTAALDPAVTMRDADAAAGDPSIGGFLRPREGSAPWLLGRHDALDVVKRAGQAAEILPQPAARRQGIRRGSRHPLVLGATRVGVAQEADRERRSDQHHMFHRMALLLATITARRLHRILGAREAPLGPIVSTRGEAGAGAGGSAGVGGAGGGATMACMSASAPPRRCATACTDRVGAAPNVRHVAWRTTQRTCLH
jgi:hypothetical protein